MYRFLIIITFLNFILLNCGHGVDITRTPVKGELPIVEKSHKEIPEWKYKISNIEDKKAKEVYFSGGVEGVHDMELGREQAQAQAINQMARSIQQYVSSKLSVSKLGGNTVSGDIGTYSESIVNITVKNLKLEGLGISEYYTEKKFNPETKEYIYDIFALLKISREKLNSAFKYASDQAIIEAQKKNNEEAIKVLNEFKNEL